MVDWKWHVTSLVAVFLALGIGVVVGTTIVGDQAVLNQQSSMLSRLEADVSALRETNARLRLEAEEARKALQHAQAFSKDILPALLADRLAGINIALVAVGGPPPAGLEEALTLAGAKLTSSTEFNPQRVPWPTLASSLGYRLTIPPERVARTVGRHLGECIALGGEGKGGPVGQGFKEGWLRREGEYGAGAVALVIVDGSREVRERLTLATLLSLAGYWRTSRGPVIVAAPGDAVGLRPYEEIGAVTVGGLEHPWGWAAVVAALAPPP